MRERTLFGIFCLAVTAIGFGSSNAASEPGPGPESFR